MSDTSVIDVKNAIDMATDVIKKLFQSDLDGLLLEGVKQEQGSPDTWEISFSFRSGDTRRETPLSAVLGVRSNVEPIRAYRTIILNAKDGSFLEMKSG